MARHPVAVLTGWAGWTLAALTASEPLPLALLAAAPLLALWRRGERVLWRAALPTVALTVLLNGLAGGGTATAFAFGGVMGLRLLAVLLGGLFFAERLETDRLFLILPVGWRRVGVTALLALRLLPVLTAERERLSEARRLRALPAPADRRTALREGALLLLAFLQGALERALSLAEALYCRGFGVGPCRRRPSLPWRRPDSVVAGIGLWAAGLLLGLAIALEPLTRTLLLLPVAGLLLVDARAELRAALPNGAAPSRGGARP